MGRILAVDDDEDCRELLRQSLEVAHEVHVATSGLEALEAAATERPDVILMDLSLPGIDGWEAARRLKADVALRSVPVIAVTAHALAGDREKALAAGCDDYLTKPLQPAQLVAKVEEWLTRPSPSG